jgi:hypothetical protein
MTQMAQMGDHLGHEPNRRTLHALNLCKSVESVDPGFPFICAICVICGFS